MVVVSSLPLCPPASKPSATTASQPASWAFVEAGDLFDPATAERLLRHIYSAGDTVEPRATYRAFRGRDARVEPMLVKRGLLPESARKDKGFSVLRTLRDRSGEGVGKPVEKLSGSESVRAQGRA